MKSQSISDALNIQKNGLAYEDPRAPMFEAAATFFTRQGGYSPPPEDSLSFSRLSADEDIRKNARVVAEFLGVDPGAIIMCDQRHSDVIVRLSSPPSTIPIADAIIAEKPGIFPAIRTADCLPILVMDPAARVSAAIHAGWRGTVKRLAQKVIQTLQRNYHTQPEDLFIALGPCIGVCCYEVGEEVIDALDAHIAGADNYVTVTSDQTSQDARRKFFVDLAEINKAEMVRCGVPEANIKKVGLCTKCRQDLFFSYRRDNGRTGRQISVVGFRR
ncbi:MAG: peptidoglycan editing factor PgeF [Desulfomonilaceae bacterium]